VANRGGGVNARRSILPTAIVAVAAAVAASPVVWVLRASLKSTAADSPGGWTTANYRQLSADRPVGRWLCSSLFVASAQTVCAVVLASLAGFALAKYRFRGRRLLTALLAMTLLLPFPVLLPGVYDLVRRLGWLDTYAAVILPGSVSVFGLFLFTRAFRAVPDDLLHAARIDGCSEFRLWWSIAVPLVRPMTAAFVLLTFTAAWNNFLWPQVVLQDEGKYTLPVGLANLSVMPGYQADYGVLMAGTVVAVLPVAVLFFALQKDFAAGLNAGAVKG
jgi:ABC-type glycerol-3-phosphate transport system permease component